MPSPWMLSKKSITGETNRGFIGDVPVEEAIQSKALPWRREDEIGPGYSKVQEEFPAWINNKEYLPYASPTNTLMGKFALIGYIYNCKSYTTMAPSNFHNIYLFNKT